MNRYLIRHLASRHPHRGHLTRGARVALAALALGLVAPGVALAAPGDLQLPPHTPPVCPPFMASCDITLPDPVDPDPDPECPPLLATCDLGVAPVDPVDPTDPTEPTDEPTDEPGEEPDHQVDPPVLANPTFTG